jgi:hypothetical protein
VKKLVNDKRWRHIYNIVTYFRPAKVLADARWGVSSCIVASSLVPSFVIWMSATRFAIRNGERRSGLCDFPWTVVDEQTDSEEEDARRKTGQRERPRIKLTRGGKKGKGSRQDNKGKVVSMKCVGGWVEEHSTAVCHG